MFQLLHLPCVHGGVRASYRACERANEMMEYDFFLAGVDTALRSVSFACPRALLPAPKMLLEKKGEAAA